MLKKLTTTDFGHYKVDIYIRNGIGGEFYTTLEGSSLPRIVIGIDYDRSEWWQLFNVLLHEVVECLLAISGFRFDQSPSISWGTDRFTFHFDHAQFSEVISRASLGLVKIIPELKKAFVKSYKSRKPTRDKKRSTTEGEQ
ncbi:MAG: hypothetical protein P8012_00100 [Desulfobacterales bacterium]